MLATPNVPVTYMIWLLIRACVFRRRLERRLGSLDKLPGCNNGQLYKHIAPGRYPLSQAPGKPGYGNHAHLAHDHGKLMCR